MSERGVFAVDRGIWTDPDFADEPFSEREAFMWLVGEAAWRATKVRVGSCIVSLARGECAFSTRFMAGKWSWSEARVRRFLGRLKNAGTIATKTDAGATQVTILNYDKFQRVSLPDADEAEQERRSTDAPATQDRRKEEDREYIKQDISSETSGSDTQAEGEKPEANSTATAAPSPDEPSSKPAAKPKSRKRITYPEAFEALWRAYPVDDLMAKLAAFREWEKLDQADRDRVMLGTPGFVAYCRKNPDYRPVHLERFIRNRRFDSFAERAAKAQAASASTGGSAERESGQRALLKRWRDSPHSWPSAMGPRPGEPGCAIPETILAEFGISTHTTAPASRASH